MGKEGVSGAAARAEQEARRELARARACELRHDHASRNDDFGWFEALYREAAGDVGAVPWAEAAPRLKLADWLAASGGPWGRGRAVDVGCGLGDNAMQLARAGWCVTAFDISPSAVSWARERFPGGEVDFRVADVLALPDAWRGGFDLVHETYNLQAMARAHVAEAMACIAALVAPGGKALVMCRGREENEQPQGPPWPLARAELQGFTRAGLSEIRFEDFEDGSDPAIRHFLAEYQRPKG